MTTAELVEYYRNLLIAQYITKANARATVAAVVTEVIADQIVQQVEDGFDLDTAVGAQLDSVGTYRGAVRTLFGIELNKTFFAMPPYDYPTPEDFKGFALYADAGTPAWFFQVYADADAPVTLSDADFRQLIKFLVKVHRSNLGLGDVDAILYEFFGNYVTLSDNGDMTITYSDDPGDPNILFQVAKFTGILPRPAGVTVKFT